jgi:hypothetical protein
VIKLEELGSVGGFGLHSLWMVGRGYAIRSEDPETVHWGPYRTVFEAMEAWEALEASFRIWQRDWP